MSHLKGTSNLHRPQDWTSAHGNSKTMRYFFGDKKKKWKCNSCGCWCSASVNGTSLSDGGESYRTAFASPPVRLRQSACSCSRLTDLYEESQSCHTLHFFSYIGFTDQEAVNSLCFHIACCRTHWCNHTQRLSAEEPGFNLSFLIIY